LASKPTSLRSPPRRHGHPQKGSSVSYETVSIETPNWFHMTMFPLYHHNSGGHTGRGFVNSIVHGFGFGLGSSLAHHLPITIVVALIIVVLIVVVMQRRSRQRGR
jgi:hypothetical protein